jgi:hypothetical protein
LSSDFICSYQENEQGNLPIHRKASRCSFSTLSKKVIQFRESARVHQLNTLSNDPALIIVRFEIILLFLSAIYQLRLACQCSASSAFAGKG